MASEWHFVLDAGSDWTQTLRWTAARRDLNGDVVKDANGKVIFDPVNTAGWTAKMQIRHPANKSLLATLGTADVVGRNGTIDFGGADGKVMIRLPGAVTDTWQNFGKLVYDIEFLSPLGAKIRWLKGTIDADPQVTI